MTGEKTITGTVFNVQRFSIHDGPGIRTTVFLKGCPLRCFWCHNPEGLRPKPEIQFMPSRCLGCGECVRVCTEGAQTMDERGRLYHRDKCLTCGKCVEVCYPEALQMTGKEMSVDQVLAEVMQDKPFYETSNGGMTLSGGEPMLQFEFTKELLRKGKEAGLHTAVETSTLTRWDNITAILDITDLFMVDIKHTDPAAHRDATGVNNDLIMENIGKLNQTGKPIIFRVPVIPTVNAEVEDIRAIAEHVRGLMDQRADGGEGISLELLPFHRLASDKYHSLGMDYRAESLTTPTKEHMQLLSDTANAAGVPTRSR